MNVLSEKLRKLSPIWLISTWIKTKFWWLSNRKAENSLVLSWRDILFLLNAVLFKPGLKKYMLSSEITPSCWNMKCGMEHFNLSHRVFSIVTNLCSLWMTEAYSESLLLSSVSVRGCLLPAYLLEKMCILQLNLESTTHEIINQSLRLLPHRKIIRNFIVLKCSTRE
jgi:hypothetical protein